MLIAFFFVSQEFHTYEFALLKTFAMTLGELEYENDFILENSKRHYSEAVNVVFVLFCLAMPIILMNMLVCYFVVYNTVIKLFFAGVRAVSYFCFESKYTKSTREGWAGRSRVAWDQAPWWMRGGGGAPIGLRSPIFFRPFPPLRNLVSCWSQAEPWGTRAEVPLSLLLFFINLHNFTF